MKLLLDIEDLTSTLMYYEYIKKEFPDLIIEKYKPDHYYKYMVYYNKEITSCRDISLFLKLEDSSSTVDNYLEFIKLIKDDIST